MIETYVDGVGEVVARLGTLSERMTEELRVAVGRLAVKLQRNVQNDKLSGQVLGVRTGRGRRSIQETVIVDGERVVGLVSTNLFYMVGWETGWGDRAQRASLKTAKEAFSLGGGDTFENGTPKKRAFLIPSLKELADSGAIEEEMSAAIGRTVQ